MILDNEALFSDAQSISVDSASTNAVKLEGEVAFGTPVEIFIQLDEGFKSTEISSLTVKVQTSESEDFTSPVDLISETLTSLNSGDRANLKFLPKGNKGYVRLKYSLSFKSGKTAATQGKITAGIVEGTSETY